MVVDIDKIIIKDRIRKDFGDISELADDIKQNGLINPPVINKDYVLLAGERRLKACKSLGWSQIEVRMMDTRDAEHELNVEISENDVRKGFTKSERVDYMKRLLRIEAAKAKERQLTGTFVENNAEVGRADEATAKQFDISASTMRKELSIVDNKDLLSEEDFADWDEGKLSTNRVFQKIKEQLKAKDEENAALRKAKSEREMEKQDLERKLEAERNKKVETVEVEPPDYQKLKDTAADYQRMVNERQKVIDENLEMKKELREIRGQTAEAKTQFKLEEDSEIFAVMVYDFIKRYAGYVYLFERINDLPEKKRNNFINAIHSLDAMIQTMIGNLGGYGIE